MEFTLHVTWRTSLTGNLTLFVYRPTDPHLYGRVSQAGKVRFVIGTAAMPACIVCASEGLTQLAELWRFGRPEFDPRSHGPIQEFLFIECPRCYTHCHHPPLALDTILGNPS